MRLFRLRTYQNPDLADHVIHFTGRRGRRNDNVDPAIAAMEDQQRLVHIVVDRRVRAFETFSSDAPVVCLTESTKAAVATLIRERSYSPCGIGFSKQFVFEKQGGPAFYVRGDEWPALTGLLPHPARCRIVRFWPGAQADPGDPPLGYHLTSQSEWLHEREWRVPGDLVFDWPDVKFLIVPHLNWQRFYADWIEGWAGDVYALAFQNIPLVVLDEQGNVVRDELGIWTP